MIAIRMNENKWRLQIGECDGEVWQFETLKEMQTALNTLLQLKNKYGRLRNEAYKKEKKKI